MVLLYIEMKIMQEAAVAHTLNHYLSLITYTLVSLHEKQIQYLHKKVPSTIRLDMHHQKYFKSLLSLSKTKQKLCTYLFSGLQECKIPSNPA